MAEVAFVLQLSAPLLLGALTHRALLLSFRRSGARLFYWARPRLPIHEGALTYFRDRWYSIGALWLRFTE